MAAVALDFEQEDGDSFWLVAKVKGPNGDDLVQRIRIDVRLVPGN